LKKFIPAIIWAALILILTLLPGKTIPGVPVWGIDKIAHLFLFAVLMYLALQGLGNQGIVKKKIIILFLLCFSYGILIEILQNFIPGRSFSVYDITANTAGIAVGYLVQKLKTPDKF
jgi:VanZ family protein